MLFPLLQKPMSLVIRFLSTPKIGYPYQIDPQLLTQVAGQIDTWDHCISKKIYPQRVSYLTPFSSPQWCQQNGTRARQWPPTSTCSRCHLALRHSRLLSIIAAGCDIVDGYPLGLSNSSGAVISEVYLHKKFLACSATLPDWEQSV